MKREHKFDELRVVESYEEDYTVEEKNEPAEDVGTEDVATEDLAKQEEEEEEEESSDLETAQTDCIEVGEIA